MMNSYDELIEALKRESELSTCSDSQREANEYMINLYQNLKNKRTSDSPTYTDNMAMLIMAKRLAEPTYRFSVRSLVQD